MKKIVTALVTAAALLLPVFAAAQTFSQRQLITTPFYGMVMSTTSANGGFLSASSTPTLAGFTATSTTATSTVQHLFANQFQVTTLCLTGDTCRTTWPTAGSSASSTLLGDTNLFSGFDTFSNLITGSISGNAGTVTNGVYTTSFNGLFDTRFITNLAATTSVKSITTLSSLSLPYSQVTGTPTILPFDFPGGATSSLVTFSGGLTAANSVTLSGITGSTQCLHVSTTGVISGTGSDCGTGSGGVTGLAATYPLLTTGSTGSITISTAFGSTTNSGIAAGNLYVGSGGIFQTAASSSIFGYTPEQPLTFNSPLSRIGNAISFLFNTINSWTGLNTFSGGLTSTGVTTLATTTASVLNGVIVVDGVHYAQTSAGIQQALSDASAISACVYLPAGRYALSTSTVLSSNSCLTGAGQGLTYLDGPVLDKGAIRTIQSGTSKTTYNNIRLKDFSIHSQTGHVFDLENIDGLNISSISASSTSGGIRETLWVQHAEHVTVTNNYLYNTKGDGIQLNDVSYFNVTNNIVDNSADDGIDIDSDFLDTGTFPSTNGTVAGNTINGVVGGYGIDIEDSQNISVTGNSVQNALIGIAVVATTRNIPVTNITVTGNTTNNNQKAGIATIGSSATTSGLLISGNTVQNEGALSASGVGAGIEASASSTQIIANTVLNGGMHTNGAEAGIIIYKVGDVVVKDNTIASSTTGIRIFNGDAAENYMNVEIANNTFKNVTNNYAGATTQPGVSIIGSLFDNNGSSPYFSIGSGFVSPASSTIGNGSQSGGLSIAGGSTTTLNAYFASKIGVGTAAPGYVADIQGNSSSNQTLNVLNNANAAFTPGAFFYAPNLGTGNEVYELLGVSSATNNSAAIGFTYAGGNGSANNRIDFNLSGQSPALSITGPNKVGIGTTSPSSVLSVQGNALFSGNLSLASLTATGTVLLSGLTSGLVGNNSGTLYSFASSSLFGYTPLNPTRNINTTYPLQGGGDFSADRTLSEAWGTTTANTFSQLQTFSGGFTAFASSTIGNGTTAGGLTVSGGATTTNLVVSSAPASGAVQTVIQNLANSATSDAQLGFINQGRSNTIGMTLSLARSPYLGVLNMPSGDAFELQSGAGKVGVGTSTPGSKLSVTSGLSVGADYGVTAPSNGAIFEGNVGIGTNSPGALLTVNGTASTTNLTISALGGATGCLSVNSSGVVGTSVCSGSGAAYPFTPSTDGGINTSATTTAIEGAAAGLGIDVAATSWYGIGGQLLGYASSTNDDTIFGLNSGGQNATTSATVGDNSSFGYQSLSRNTTGIENAAFGAFALTRNTSGSSNTGLGYEAGFFNTTGNNNTSVGFQTLLNITTGSNNTALGSQAGRSVTTGYSNTLIGDNSQSLPSTITSGGGNIGIGSNIFFPSITANQQLNIGNLIFGSLPATTSGFQLPTSGSIGIGTSTPFAKFAIAANNGDTNTTLFAIGSSTATATTTLFSVSNTGSIFTKLADGCVQAASGFLTSTGTACGSGGGGAAYPFTPSTDGGIKTSATTTPLEGAPLGLGIDIPATSWYGIGGQYFAYGSSSVGSTYLGFSAGGNQATTTDSFWGGNTVVGDHAGPVFNQAFNDTLVGANAGLTITSGFRETAIGVGAAQGITTGSDNVHIGYLANTGSSGTLNVVVGDQAGSTGAFNFSTLVGYQAGNSLLTGADTNIFIGDAAGANTTSGYGNVLIGTGIIPLTITTGHNNINLGEEIFNVDVTASNQLNIGNLIYGTIPATTTAFHLPTTGSFGIGSSTPFSKFAIQTNNGDTATTLFAIGSSTANSTTTLFSISNTGNTFFNAKVGLGTTSPFALFSINANALTTPAFVIGSSTATVFSVDPSISGGDIFDVATSTTGSNVWGIMNSGLVFNTGSRPSAATSTGSGSGSVPVIITGTGNDFNFNLVTGTTPTAAATIATFTLPSSCPSATVPTFSPANSKTQAIAVVSIPFASSTASNTFVLVAGATGLTAATNYIWNFHVGCY